MALIMVLKKFYGKILLREMIERKHSDWYSIVLAGIFGFTSLCVLTQSWKTPHLRGWAIVAHWVWVLFWLCVC